MTSLSKDILIMAQELVDNDNEPNYVSPDEDAEHIRALKTVVIDLQQQIRKMKGEMNNLKRQVRMQNAKF